MKILIISVLAFLFSQAAWAGVRKRDVCEWIVTSPLFDSLNAKVVKPGIISFLENDKIVVTSAQGTATLDGIALAIDTDRTLSNQLVEWIYQIPKLLKNLKVNSPDEAKRKELSEKLRALHNDINNHLMQCEQTKSEAVAAAARDVKKTLDAIATQIIGSH